MKLQRLTLLGLMLALLLLVGACGSDDDEGTGAATTEDGSSEAVSGSISVIGVWTGPEQASFQAVIDGFKEQNPDATVKYTSGGDNIVTVLSTAVEGGNPPDIATVSQPGTMADFVERGALKPLDFAVDAVQENFGESIVDTGSVDGTLYGLLFKAANKSTVWYNVASFADAGVEAPDTWDDFLEDAKTLSASGVPAYSIGGADGWTLTDLFENIYLRTAGAEKYDQLAKHEIPWTDQSVKDALAEMAKIVGDTDNIAGGKAGALQTDFPTSVANVFSASPKAAMVIEGDFVPGVAGDKNPLEPEEGFNIFPFPSIDDSARCGRRRRRPRRHVQGQPGRDGIRRVPDDAGGIGDLGEARRLLVAEQEGRLEHLPGPDPGDDSRCARRGGDLPLRPVRPAAVRVRRHRRPGSVQAVPGLRRRPAGHRRDHHADGGRGSEGVRLAACRRVGQASQGSRRSRLPCPTTTPNRLPAAGASTRSRPASSRPPLSCS